MRTILTLAAAIALVACGTQRQAETPAKALKATATMVIGDAGLLRAGEPGRKPLRPGDALKPEDVVLTGRNGTVNIAIEDTGLLRVGPDSQVVLASLLLKADGGSDQRIAVRQGRVTLGLKKLRRESSFRVDAPTAVAGVRGTAFVVDVQGASGQAFPYFVKVDPAATRTRVAVFSGSVEMSSKKDSGAAVLVEPMKMAVLDGDDFANIKIVPIERLYLGELEELRKMSELRSVELSDVAAEIGSVDAAGTVSVQRRLSVQSEVKRAGTRQEEAKVQDSEPAETKVEKVRTGQKREGKYLEAGEGW